MTVKKPNIPIRLDEVEVELSHLLTFYLIVLRKGGLKYFLNTETGEMRDELFTPMSIHIRISNL